MCTCSFVTTTQIKPTLISLMSVSGCANGGENLPPTFSLPIFANRVNPLIFLGRGRGGSRRGPSPDFLSLKHDKNFKKSLKRQGNTEIDNLTTRYYLLTVIRFSYSVRAINFLTISGFFNFRFHSLP